MGKSAVTGKFFIIDAFVAVPIFLGLAFFISWISGDKDRDRLRDRLSNAAIENSQLRDQNAAMSYNVRELLFYQLEAQKNARRAAELEKELEELKSGTNKETEPADPDKMIELK